MIYLRFHGSSISYPTTHRISNWIYQLTYQRASTSAFVGREINWPKRRETNAWGYKREISVSFCCPIEKGLLNKNHSMICNNQLTIHFFYVVGIPCRSIFKSSHFNSNQRSRENNPIEITREIGYLHKPWLRIPRKFQNWLWSLFVYQAESKVYISTNNKAHNLI